MAAELLFKLGVAGAEAVPLREDDGEEGDVGLLRRGGGVAAAGCGDASG